MPRSPSVELTYRPITSDEVDEFFRSDARSFGRQMGPDELASHPPIREMDRTLAAFEGGRIVGGARILSSGIYVPGGRLPMMGVAIIGVLPTHRRRGIFSEMMSRVLRDAHERGEPLSLLTASESVIYARFGYGIGALQESWTIESKYSSYASPHQSDGRLFFVEPDEMRETFPEVYARAMARRPGACDLSDYFWDHQAKAPWPGPGTSPFFHLAYEQDGSLDGYARYRTVPQPDQDEPGNNDIKLIVEELTAVTPEAHAALWRFCFDVDLATSIEAWKRPVDDPLPWMLTDSRRLQRTRSDAMWIRLVDVAAALSGRRYRATDRLVIELNDSFCPWNEGQLEIEGGPDGAECRPSTDEADLALSAADLAAAYLGTVSFTTLSMAGRVEERTRGALLRADSMFASELAPWFTYAF